MPFLTLDGVSKRFDGVIAVDQVSFAIDRGEVVGFLGPNGAGKSTTMRMITQYIEPDAGTIRLDGVALAVAGREAKRRIGYLPESNPLYGDMLVADYLAFIADLRGLAGVPRERSFDEAVTSTGIQSVYYRPIGELSKGYRQRVGPRRRSCTGRICSCWTSRPRGSTRISAGRADHAPAGRRRHLYRDSRGGRAQ